MGRIAVVLTGLLAALAAMLAIEWQQPAVYRIAQNMLGQNWYRIQLNADHVGFMYNRGYRDQAGRWHFLSTTHFQLQDNAPNTISKHLTFAARAPSELIEARYSHHSTQQLTTVVRQHEDGYVAHLSRSGQSEADGNNIPLDWQGFDLNAFFSIETWLAGAHPAADSQFIVHSPDFERLRIDQRSYRVVEENDEGYLVETSAPFAATRTQLDQHFKPVRLNMAGIFDVIATDEADAISLTHLRRKTRYLFDVDQRLPDHTELAELHLRVNGAVHPQLPQELSLSYNPVISRGNGSEYTGEELRYPITYPAIQELAQRSVAQDTTDTISRLVDSANRQLQYAEDQPAGSVLKALASGRGECTDYADLFTTLARAAGFPARNVYGLAYKDGTQPAFMFHAWNEVFADGRWQSVDPTWNQTRVDASHIPLTDAQAALMMLANNTGGVTFSVLGTAYF